MINNLVSFPIWKNDGREIVDLNDLQKKQIKNFLSKLKSGEYKFLENPCLCGNTDKSLDILVAEKDRYGIAYGFSEDEANIAYSTSHLVEEHIKKEEINNIKNVKIFIKECNEYFKGTLNVM